MPTTKTIPQYLHHIASAMRAAGETAPANTLDHIADDADSQHPGLWGDIIPEAVDIAHHWDDAHAGAVSAP